MVGATNSTPSSSPTITLRLYLIRHAETEANARRIVAGHLETPLTVVGRQQAATLGDKVPWLREIGTNGIHRYFVSDMGRTQETATGILGLEKLPLKEGDVAPIVTLEQRIREQAKGAREGQRKEMSYQEALDRYRGHPASERTEIPLLEQESDVWRRTKSWLDDVAKQIYQNHDQEGCGSQVSMYSVVAVSHSGTIRVICQNLVESELPAHVTTTPADENGSTPSHLKIPNASVTVIDLEVTATGIGVHGVGHEIERGAWKNPTLRQLTWTVKSRELLMDPAEE